eukprot:1795591-Prorocentrum_lima.AAC.1
MKLQHFATQTKVTGEEAWAKGGQRWCQHYEDICKKNKTTTILHEVDSRRVQLLRKLLEEGRNKKDDREQ